MSAIHCPRDWYVLGDDRITLVRRYWFFHDHASCPLETCTESLEAGRASNKGCIHSRMILLANLARALASHARLRSRLDGLALHAALDAISQATAMPKVGAPRDTWLPAKTTDPVSFFCCKSKSTRSACPRILTTAIAVTPRRSHFVLTRSGSRIQDESIQRFLDLIHSLADRIEVGYVHDDNVNDILASNLDQVFLGPFRLGFIATGKKLFHAILESEMSLTVLAEADIRAGNTKRQQTRQVSLVSKASQQEGHVQEHSERRRLSLQPG